MFDPQRKRVKGDGVELELAVWPGDELPILCIHGLTANSRCWTTLAQGLTPKHGMIAFDLRGRGLSEKPESGYSIPIHCRDMVALMDGLGLPRAHIMGHSLGASIAALFAAEHPERVDHLVLLDGAGKLNKAQTARVVAGITPSVQRLGQVYPSLEDYLSMLKNAPYLTDWTEAHEVYFRYEVEAAEGGVRTRTRLEHIMEEITNLLNFEVSDYYSRIKCPTLIVRACRGMLRDDDILLPPNAVSRMTKSILDTWLMSLEKANHYSILFAKNEVRDNVILNFLRS